MYIMFDIVDTPFIMEENWLSANHFRNADTAFLLCGVEIQSWEPCL